MSNIKNNLHKIFLLTYCIIMLWLLFGQRLPFLSFEDYSQRLVRNLNLVPFKTIIQYTQQLIYNPHFYLVRHSFINLAGNIVMFIPLGMLLPFNFAYAKSFFKCLLLSAGVIVCVEVVQLFTLLGSCDIDDLIFNLFGVALGYTCYLLWQKIRNNKK